MPELGGIRTLAAESSWNPEALFDTVHHGLSERLKDELAAQEITLDLDSLITPSFRIDGRPRESRCERRSGLGNTRLSDAGTRPKESGNPQSVYFQGEPKTTEVPRKSSTMDELDTPEPMQL